MKRERSRGTISGLYAVTPGAVRATLDLLESARRDLDLPLVAIGGITPADARELLAAGADALAVISALFAAPDIGAAARHFTALFELSS